MKRLLLVLLMTGIGFGCSEEEFDINEPTIDEENKTATIVLNNIPQANRGDSVFIFTLNNKDEFYSATSASAIEDSEITTSVPPGSASFTIVGYIPTVTDWSAENAFGSAGFYSTIAGATDRSGRFITTSWEESDNYDVSSKSGASDVLAIQLSINGLSELTDNSFGQGEILSLSADVTNNLIAGIASVSFQIDGTQIEEVDQEPYSINFNTVDYEPGVYVISTTVTNEEGDTSSDEIEIVITSDANVAPSVSISGINNGATYTRQSIRTIESNVSDDNGIDDIDRVEFIINGARVSTVTESPFTYEWDTFDNQVGAVTVEVVAIDQAGAQRSDFVNVSLVAPNNYFPRVNLTSPSNNQSIPQGNLITLRANTSDIEGDDIDYVRFRIFDENGFLQYSSNVFAAPYEVVDYNTQGLAPGRYEIEARVYGSGGSSTDTRIINITQ